MAQHLETEEKNYDYLYYVGGLVTGIIIGILVDNGPAYIIGNAIVWTLIGAFFLKVLVKGRENA